METLLWLWYSLYFYYFSLWNTIKTLWEIYSQLSAVEGNTPSIGKASGGGSTEFQPCLIFQRETDCGSKTAKHNIWACGMQKAGYPPEKHPKGPEDHPWKQYDYSCCVGKPLSNRKGDGSGSENVGSIKLKSVATLPLATVESRFPPICSKFTLGSALEHPSKTQWCANERKGTAPSKWLQCWCRLSLCGGYTSHSLQ